MNANYTYYCNVNIRDKFFGYTPGDELVRVGTIEATSLDDAYRKFNRIDEPVPVLDEAEAPSMSTGDVVHVYNYTDDTDEWLAVARFGFDPIPVIDPQFLILDRKVSEVIQNRY